MNRGRKHAVNLNARKPWRQPAQPDPLRAMTSTPTIADIQSDFEMLDDWEDRYRYIIELGRQLAPLPADAKNDATKVRGCASQVWLVSNLDAAARTLSFQGESDSHIVQGLIAILLALTNGRPAADLTTLDIQSYFNKLGLKEHLTPQRSNGLASMIGRIKADAQAAI